MGHVLNGAESLMDYFVSLIIDLLTILYNNATSRKTYHRFYSLLCERSLIVKLYKKQIKRNII